MSKAESKQLIQPDDGEISEEESLVYISDEKHPSGVSKAAENRRERRLCYCVIGVMMSSVIVGILVAIAVFVTIKEGYFDQQNSKTTISVNTDLVERSGDWVVVEWQYVDHPNTSDWLGLYSVPNYFNEHSIDPTKKAPIKFQYANYSHTHMSEGRGSIRFRLINIRQPLVFSLFRGGLNTTKEMASFTNGTTLAISKVVRFKNWNEPLQAHLALTNDPTEMIVSWVTNSSKTPQVKWGTKSGVLDKNMKAITSSYSASDMCGSPAIDFGYRDPGFLHKATLTGLQPGLTYYYMCGDDEFGWSQEFSFTAAQPGNPNKTTRAIVYGDMGNGHRDGTWQVIREQPAALNTSNMLRGFVNFTDVVFHIGDISYARGFANVWDEFFDEIQPICANVPYMVCIGNHERNWNESSSYWKSHDSEGECGIPYEKRFFMPRPAQNQTWYSVDYGNIHFLVMSTEDNFTVGSIQYKYLENDLSKVNKSNTPWIILIGHRPMYVYSVNDSGSYAGVQPVAKLLRENVEHLLKEYEVDLALWGHEHAYQRTCPVYQEQCVGTGNGTTHVIVGMGGQKHSTDYPEQKPDWLKWFDKKYYGVSNLTANASHLILEYLASEDGKPRVNDTITLTHDDAKSK